MNIDMAALHAIEADKGISVDVVVDTIKSALLTAYRHTEGHEADAHIDIDRKTGAVIVMARETDEDGNVLSEWDDTPEGFGRVAATTARQVMLQRFRDAENERMYGEFSAREGDIVGGVVQRDARENTRGNVMVRLGTWSFALFNSAAVGGSVLRRPISSSIASLPKLGPMTSIVSPKAAARSA